MSDFTIIIGIAGSDHVYIRVERDDQLSELAIGTQEARMVAMQIMSAADKIDAFVGKKEVVN